MVLSLLQKRRSIRRFQDRPVEEEKVEILREALLRSPSSRGRNPWEFVVVTDRTLLRQLAAAKEHGSAFLTGAPLVVVVAADPQRCDVWVEDCAIAAIILQLAAESLGLGSCWAQIRLREHDDGRSAEAYVKELLGLPEGCVVECIVGLGYPAEQKPGHPRDELAWEKIHRNRYVP